MADILNTIDEHLTGADIVYFHCWGGHGRTGTVAGCWMKRHGIAKGKEVFNVIRELRMNMKDAHRESPETEEQRDFVRRWSEGE